MNPVPVPITGVNIKVNIFVNTPANKNFMVTI
jgi:hypothetical protein